MDAGTMTSAAIEARDVRKRFGAVAALDGIDLSVPTGMVYALLGPNGAGKTTLIRAIVGLVRTDGGELRVLGGAVLARWFHRVKPIPREPASVRAPLHRMAQGANARPLRRGWFYAVQPHRPSRHCGADEGGLSHHRRDRYLLQGRGASLAASPGRTAQARPARQQPLAG
jgi:energy-coupling factor transporter ATP-binding protein EcfA2